MTVGFSLSKSSQHSVFIEINEIKKISTWERLTMSVLIFRTIIHLHIHLDDKSCWFTLTTETYLTTVFKATHSIKSEVVRSFEKATDIKYKGIFFFCAPYVTQATNHLENYHMNTENPAWDIGYIFVNVVLNYFFLMPLHLELLFRQLMMMCAFYLLYSFLFRKIDLKNIFVICKSLQKRRIHIF